MRQNDILHFVEVKARRSFRFGRPEEAVDGLKRRRLFRASKSFLYEHPSWKEKCGYFLFDVMEVDLVRRALHWIPDAFSMEGEE